MAYLNDDVIDNGLVQLPANVDEIHICSQEPVTYVQATVTYTLGVKSAPDVSAPRDRTGGGREVEAASFTDGQVTGTGTATHFAWVDVTNTRLYVAQLLDAGQVVTTGNLFWLDAHAVGIPDAT